MGLIAGVVERLVQPIGMRVLLAWERRESGVAYEETELGGKRIRAGTW